MLAILRDLLRYNVEFRIGVVLVGFVVVLSALSAVSPYPPQDVYVVPPDVPPSLSYWLGTTSRGQDVFWQLTFAIRNTLLFGCTVALISRMLALMIGLLSGYKGGWTDRAMPGAPFGEGIACPANGGPRFRGDDLVVLVRKTAHAAFTAAFSAGTRSIFSQLKEPSRPGLRPKWP